MPAKKQGSDPRFRLPKEERVALIRKAQKYLLDEFDIEAGDLAAELLLEHVGTLIAPVLYNRGVEDARKVVAERAVTIEEELFGLTRQSLKEILREE